MREFFARPVKTLVWAFSMGIGVAALALISTGIARETRIRDRGPLLVAYSLEPDGPSNSVILLLPVNTSLPGDDETIRNLRLRFDQKQANEADVQVISPAASVEDLGGGRYFKWDTFKPGQTIRVRLRRTPRLNLDKLKMDMVANGFNRFSLPKKAPVDLFPNRSN